MTSWDQPLRPDEISALAENISSPDECVASHALRACVRLSLTAKAWALVGAHARVLVRRLGSMSSELALQVASNAARIPGDLRADLLAFMADGALDTLRRVLRRELARAGDERVYPFVVQDLSAAAPEVRRAAARDLAGLRDAGPHPLEQYERTETDQAALFWFALAGAICGRPARLLSFLAHSDLPWHEWGIMYNDGYVEQCVLPQYAAMLSSSVMDQIRSLGEQRAADSFLALSGLSPASPEDWVPPTMTEAEREAASAFVEAVLEDRTDLRRLWYPTNPFGANYSHIESRKLGRAAVRLLEQQFIHLSTRREDDSSRFASPWEGGEFESRLFDYYNGEQMALTAGAMLGDAEGVQPEPLFRWYLWSRREQLFTGVQLAAAASYATPREVLIAMREVLVAGAAEDRVTAAEFIVLARQYVGRGLPTWGGDAPLPDVLASPAEAKESELVRCQPRFEAPTGFELAQEFEVTLQLDRVETAEAAVKVEAVSGWKTLTIDLELIVDGGRIVFQSSRSVELSRSGGSSALLVRVFPTAEAHVTVRALFSYRGTPCGWCRAEIVRQRDAIETISDGLSINLDTVPPEMTIWLQKIDRLSYATAVLVAEEFRFIDGMPDCRASRHQLAAQEVSELQSSLDVMAAAGEAARGRLYGIADSIYDELPSHVRQAYEALRAMCGDGFSIQIMTDDPGVPWELARPVFRGRRSNLLCETHPIARWSARRCASLTPALASAGEVLSLAPDYRNEKLPRAQEEQVWVCENIGARIISLDRNAFLARLRSTTPIRLLLIAAHASYGGLQPFSSALKLADGPEEWVSADELRGERKDALRGALVFLNACEAGTTGGAWGAVGIATAFIEGGAAAVIAPLWPVDDREAYEMAKRLLKRIAARGRLSSVLRDARHSETNSVDPLAYVLWGHVDASY